MRTELWIVGELLADHEHTWQFVGVFDSISKAVEACTTPNHWYGPAILNERLPDTPVSWRGGCFPLDTSPQPMLMVATPEVIEGLKRGDA